MSYSDFIAGKLQHALPTGLSYDPRLDAYDLLPHQHDLVRWSLRRGRCAIFADTGLGKTRMQLAWADQVHRVTGFDVLILAPLAVAAQTVEEGKAIGVTVHPCRERDDARPGINITNYDRLHKFEPAAFGAVVLDESSCIKHSDTKTLAALLQAFASTPFKLCATATPAPNDWTELGTHAEFLGICSRAEMLAEYFVHDGGETQVWRLKGHAREQFWRWVASWGAMVRRPSDLGHDDSAYLLPPLHIHEHLIETQAEATGMLFALEASTLSERRAARKGSLADRVAACAAMVNATEGPAIVWCDLNDESKALVKAIDGALEITGADDVDVKEARLDTFKHAPNQRLISKPSICGFGLNWQHCATMAFVGVTDSYEAYYQAVRRIWRFGQTQPCHVHIYASHLEGAVVANLKRKEAAALSMADQLSTATRDAVRAEVTGVTRQTNSYLPRQRITVPHWLTSEIA
ncbi:helicase [Dyella jiangningensis]|nr:helicase [Dyella jiangningensis]